jgi:hypothetical protein
MAVTEHGLLASAPDRIAESRRTARNPVPWRLIGAAGLTFGLVGWTDVLLLWYPLRVGRPDWEFATVSGTFDALPLATIGTLLVVAWLHAAGPRGLRVLAGSALFLVVLGLVGAFVLFGLSFATGLGSVEADTQWILVRAGIKTAVSAFAYVTLYILMALSLIRAPRKDRAV